MDRTLGSGNGVLLQGRQNLGRFVRTCPHQFGSEVLFIQKARKHRCMNHVVRHWSYPGGVLGSLLPARQSRLNDEALHVFTFVGLLADVRSHQRGESGNEHAGERTGCGNDKRGYIHVRGTLFDYGNSRDVQPLVARRRVFFRRHDRQHTFVLCRISGIEGLTVLGGVVSAGGPRAAEPAGEAAHG